METKISKSELFKRMNALRKEHGLSQREAYAIAKQQLSPQPEPEPTLGEQLLEKMKTANVRFAYKNNKDNVIVTVGTLRFDRVPTARKVQGSQKVRRNNTLFYDVRHGVYRQFNPDNTVEIQAVSTRR